MDFAKDLIRVNIELPPSTICAFGSWCDIDLFHQYTEYYDLLHSENQLLDKVKQYGRTIYECDEFIESLMLTGFLRANGWKAEPFYNSFEELHDTNGKTKWAVVTSQPLSMAGKPLELGNWNQHDHNFFPDRIREEIECIFMASKRNDNLFGTLPTECVLLICFYIATYPLEPPKQQHLSTQNDRIIQLEKEVQHLKLLIEKHIQ